MISIWNDQKCLKLKIYFGFSTFPQSFSMRQFAVMILLSNFAVLSLCVEMYFWKLSKAFILMTTMEI